MKAKKLFLLVALSGLLVLSACGKKEETTTSKTTSAEVKSEKVELGPKPLVDASKYVESLADYKNITYKLTPVEITQEQIDTAAQEQIMNMSAYKPVEREAMENDQVDIDYVGKKDGVAFDNGSAQGYKLVLGSKSFIDGFETGLIGKKAGETVELNLTFPENYPNDELKGAAVVFEVKINSVSEPITPELTDDFLKASNIGIQSVEDFKASVKSQLETSAKQTSEQEKVRQIIEGLTTGTKFKELPKELVSYYSDFYRNQFTTYGQYMGLSAEEYAKQVFGLSTDKELDTKLKELAEDEAKLELILSSIAKAEGLEASDEDVNMEIQKYIESQGSNTDVTKESLLEKQGGIENYRQNMSLNKAYQFVMENAKETK